MVVSQVDLTKSRSQVCAHGTDCLQGHFYAKPKKFTDDTVVGSMIFEKTLASE